MRFPESFPLSHFRENTAQHIRRMQRSNRPTLLTQKGRGALVVMSQEAYEKLAQAADFVDAVEAIRESLADPRADIPLAESYRRMKAKFAGGAKSGKGKRHRAA